jgi:hypothetical protein
VGTERVQQHHQLLDDRDRSWQTLQINVVAFPPNPCFAQLGFQDINGNPVGTTLNVAL